MAFDLHRSANQNHSSLLERIEKQTITIAALLLMVGSACLFWIDRNNWLPSVPWSELASTMLGIGLLGLAYDAFIRVEARNVFKRVAEETLWEQADTIAKRVVTEALSKPDALLALLGDSALDDVGLAALQRRLGDPVLAQGVLSAAQQSALLPLWRNYRCHVVLEEAQDGENEARSSLHYDAYIEVEYITKLERSEFWFCTVRSIDDYDRLRTDPAWEVVWSVEANRYEEGDRANRYEEGDPLLFDVSEVLVADDPLKIDRGERSGHIGFVARREKSEALQGKEVAVKYRYRVKIQKNAHSLMIKLPYYTSHAVIELDVERTDIAHVTPFDCIVSQEGPRIVREFSSSVTNIRVVMPGLVQPNSGMVFAWVSHRERSAASRALDI